MNFSKSGIGYSVGVRGARIGKDAKGRKYSQISIPHTGICRRDYYNSKARPSSATPQLPVPSQLPQGVAQPRIQWRSILRSPWALCGGGSLLLYALIRAIS